MTGSEIRRRFLEHFRSRDHLVLDSASLIPDRDPTTLFNSAGMQPLKPYYQGVSRPPAPRLTSSQKCFRTQDLDEVGDDRHNTFFEMLGNFAPTGDYFKEGAIPYAWELVTLGYGIPKERVRVTIHPTDDEAAELWRRETDIRADWIYRSEGDSNWWAAGETGPCGPDSELWYDRGPGYGCGQDDCFPDHCERFLEFWNLVFMQFDRQRDGTLAPLPKPGMDTGMGLERITSILQGVDNSFETDLFLPLLAFVREHSRESRLSSERLIADHLRGMSFVIGDGVLPSNEGRGYVLRRLIRRALLHQRHLAMSKPLSAGVEVVVAAMKDQYPELEARSAYIKDTIEAEATRFGRTLEQGMELFEKVVARHPAEIPGAEAFKLHDTFGFPLELTQELAAERGLGIDVSGFQAAMAAQRVRSRSMSGQRWAETSSLPTTEFLGYDQLEAQAQVVKLRRGGADVEQVREGEEVEVYLDRSPFYAESGGQIGDTGTLTGPAGQLEVEDTQKPADRVHAHLARVLVGSLSVGDHVSASVHQGRRRQIARHHSATHLLHKALHEVLGESAVQKGSWVGPDRTTFDFPFGRAVSPEELDRITRRVNQQVRSGLPFQVTLKPYREAVESGAMHLFEEKYGDVVRIVCFGDWSCELCGGTHVQNSADVGSILIVSEASVGAGLRRIEMVVGEAADELVQRRLGALAEAGRTLGVAPDQVPRRVEEIRAQLKESERRVRELRDELRVAQVQGGGGGSGPQVLPARVPLIAQAVSAESSEDLRAFADRFMESLGGSGVVALTSAAGFVIKVSRDLTAEIDANRFTELFGNGGGRPELVQGRLAKTPEEAFERLQEALQ